MRGPYLMDPGLPMPGFLVPPPKPKPVPLDLRPALEALRVREKHSLYRTRKTGI